MGFLLLKKALSDFKTCIILMYIILNGEGIQLAMVYIGTVLFLFFLSRPIKYTWWYFFAYVLIFFLFSVYYLAVEEKRKTTSKLVEDFLDI